MNFIVECPSATDSKITAKAPLKDQKTADHIKVEAAASIIELIHFVPSSSVCAVSHSLHGRGSAQRGNLPQETFRITWPGEGSSPPLPVPLIM